MKSSSPTSPTPIKETETMHHLSTFLPMHDLDGQAGRDRFVFLIGIREAVAAVVLKSSSSSFACSLVPLIIERALRIERHRFCKMTALKGR